MKQRFLFIALLFSISLLLNFGREKIDVPSSHGPLKEFILDSNSSQSFSQADIFADINGRRDSSREISTCNPLHKSVSSRRSVLDSLSGVKIAIASLFSQSGYSYSCNFPFEHQPERELFFFLRNIRI